MCSFLIQGGVLLITIIITSSILSFLLFRPLYSMHASSLWAISNLFVNLVSVLPWKPRWLAVSWHFTPNWSQSLFCGHSCPFHSVYQPHCLYSLPWKGKESVYPVHFTNLWHFILYELLSQRINYLIFGIKPFMYLLNSKSFFSFYFNWHLFFFIVVVQMNLTSRSYID